MKIQLLEGFEQHKAGDVLVVSPNQAKWLTRTGRGEQYIEDLTHGEENETTDQDDRD